MAKHKKNPQHFTILLVPDQGRAVRKISIPKAWVKRFPLIAGLTGLATIIFIGLFLYYRQGYQAHQSARKELLRVQQTMQQVDAHLKILEGTLERITSFDTKLRMMTHLQDPQRQLAMGPLGPLGNETGDDLETDSPFDEVLPYLNTPTTPQTPDDLLITVRRLQEKGAKEETSLVALVDQMHNQELVLAATPATWPVDGFVSSRFGMRISPFTKKRRFHAGIDIAAAPGTLVRAPGDGTVLFVGQKPGYGYTLIIDHGYGIVTCFAHNSEVVVKNSDKIRRGQVIAKVGNTGRSTGPHLHYEVRLNGAPQDPGLFILN